MKTKSLGFIGGGRITKVILQAIANNKTEYKAIAVYDTNSAVLSALQNQFPGILLAESATEAAKQDMVFLALHPPLIMDTLELVKDQFNPGSILISLAPKITIEKMASKLKNFKNIVRLFLTWTSQNQKGTQNT
ncbi:MAG: NAD(P)-binding domain-containing protein [Bacteroidota bacterium]